MAMLHLSGISWRRLAVITGMSETNIRDIRNRPTVWPDIAATILAVSPDPVARPQEQIGYVPAQGSVRRVQALFATGYTLTALGAILGMSATAVQNIANERTEFVNIKTARAINAAYTDLQMKPLPTSGHAKFARTLAERRGYAPPFAWEDIDDPDAKPVIAKEDKEYWFTQYLELKRMGYSNAEIARRLSITCDTLQKRLQRLSPRQREQRNAA
jgi:transcriptional regulator with XRE-family HTH domain